MIPNAKTRTAQIQIAINTLQRRTQQPKLSSETFSGSSREKTHCPSPQQSIVSRLRNPFNFSKGKSQHHLAWQTTSFGILLGGPRPPQSTRKRRAFKRESQCTAFSICPVDAVLGTNIAPLTFSNLKEASENNNLDSPLEESSVRATHSEL